MLKESLNKPPDEPLSELHLLSRANETYFSFAKNNRLNLQNTYKFKKSLPHPQFQPRYNHFPLRL